MTKLADCRKAFTNRCPHRAEIKQLRAEEGRNIGGILTYYNPRYWEQAERFCIACEDFEAIRAQIKPRTGPEILKSDLSSKRELS